MQDKIIQFLDKNVSKFFANKMKEDVIRYQKIYNFERGADGSMWNNESDAFRHAYMQAFIACLSESTAKKFGDAHEKNGNARHQDIAEARMDFHNNIQGREIAKELKKELAKPWLNPFDTNIQDKIAEKVIKRMNEGKLILNPQGKRKPKSELKLRSERITMPEGCAGTYSVSGYTRSDGLKVPSYERTCGAKHLNKKLN